MTLLESALRYAHLGLRVVPLRERSKKPTFENWPVSATTDKGQIERWWKQNPKSNVGVATGKQSGVFVLDVDKKNRGDDTYEHLVNVHGRLPNTWQQITGTGGWHQFFRYPSFPVGSFAGLFPGIDIRGDGGQVVVPPSVHPETGREYEWDGLDEIEQCPLSEAPLWLLDALHLRAEHRKQPVEVPEKIPHGVQHYTLLAIAGAMRRMGMTADEMIPSLLVINAERCERPGEEKAVRQIAQSLMRYAPADQQVYSTATKLWSLTRKREIEKHREEEKLNLVITDGLTAYRRPVADVSCTIEGLLYRGVTLFSGRPKQGKSFLALQLALNVAHGTKVFGSYEVPSPGGVLYLDLEGNAGRTAKRLKSLLAVETPFLQNLNISYAMLPLLTGGSDQLRHILDASHPSLVIVDTFLALAGGAGNSDKNPMRSEYKEITALTKIAHEFETSILLVHHLRKAQPGEVMLDAVAGTTGLTAAADAIWTLKRENPKEYILDVTGRECPEASLALQFSSDPDAFGWQCSGSGDEVKDQKLEKQISEMLSHEGPMVLQKITMQLKATYPEIQRCVYRMADRGRVTIDDKGRVWIHKGAA